MLSWGLNHMTMRQASAKALLEAAERLGCAGVELRNDLDQPLFDGMSPEEFGAEARNRRLRLLALAEVYGFNGSDTDQTREKVRILGTQAKACGAEAIVLIPKIADAPVDRATQRKHLHRALADLRPLIEDIGVTALVEPFGFVKSSLRRKEDAVRVLDDMGRPECFFLVHDTFHHFLAGESAIYPELTKVVHISGVIDETCLVDELTDAHRELVGPADRLKNLAQIRGLVAEGYSGPYSIEAFSPDVHALQDPIKGLSTSIEFMTSSFAESTAA